jgi:hypothetical protein
MAHSTSTLAADPTDWLLPDPTWSVGAPFWAAVQQEELRFPRCTGCGRFAWYPVPRCAACGSHEFDWTAIDPVGHVHSFTVVRRAFLPQFADRLPLGVVQARFPEAPEVTLICTLEPDGDPEALAVGRAMQVVYHSSPSGFTLPFARLLAD